MDGSCVCQQREAWQGQEPPRKLTIIVVNKTDTGMEKAGKSILGSAIGLLQGGQPTFGLRRVLNKGF